MAVDPFRCGPLLQACQLVWVTVFPSEGTSTWCHSATAKLQGCFDANPPIEISTALSQRRRFSNVSAATVTLVL